MKKLIGALAALVMVAGIIGCTEDQEKAVARQLGIASAVTWIGTDNPSTNDIATAKQVAIFIRDASTNVTDSANTSYYAVLYPVVDKYITEKVELNKQPAARLAAAWMLTGIDTAFAMNPSWAKKQASADKIVNAFCDGFIIGLNMAPTDPVVKAATRQTSVRMKIKSIR